MDFIFFDFAFFQFFLIFLKILFFFDFIFCSLLMNYSSYELGKKIF